MNFMQKTSTLIANSRVGSGGCAGSGVKGGTLPRAGEIRGLENFEDKVRNKNVSAF